jgi:hypothetical protein
MSTVQAIGSSFLLAAFMSPGLQIAVPTHCIQVRPSPPCVQCNSLDGY